MKERVEMASQGRRISRALRELLDEARRLGCKNPKLFFEAESAAVFVLDGDHEHYANDRANASERQQAIVVEAPISTLFDTGAW